MRRSWVPAAAFLLLAAPMSARGDGSDEDAASDDHAAPDEDVVVDLFDRVPRRWVSDAADELPLQSARWRRRLPERCHTRGGYREHCQGERRIPEPHGPAAERARRLALGHRATALQLRHGEAFEEWLEVVDGADPDRELHWPVPDGRLGREFGRVRRGNLSHRRHFGIDIGADEGARIEAARGGLVVYADDGLTGFGNAVMILHEDDTTTFYAHCHAAHVFAGQMVERGDHVADVGSTGFAHRPHLHFEWRSGGWARDPLPYMADRARRYGHERPGRCAPGPEAPSATLGAWCGGTRAPSAC